VSDSEDKVLLAFVSDGDVFHYMSVEIKEETDGLIAAMLSEPKIVNVSHMADVMPSSGWKYENGNFFRSEPICADPGNYEVA
jgi:hypothetical protein